MWSLVGDLIGPWIWLHHLLPLELIQLLVRLTRTTTCVVFYICPEYISLYKTWDVCKVSMSLSPADKSVWYFTTFIWRGEKVRKNRNEVLALLWPSCMWGYIPCFRFVRWWWWWPSCIVVGVGGRRGGSGMTSRGCWFSWWEGKEDREKKGEWDISTWENVSF